MDTYKTFIRTCTSWRTFAKARKTTVDTRLSYDEAKRACERFNNRRTAAQVRRGTMMEFTKED